MSTSEIEGKIERLCVSTYDENHLNIVGRVIQEETEGIQDMHDSDYDEDLQLDLDTITPAGSDDEFERDDLSDDDDDDDLDAGLDDILCTGESLGLSFPDSAKLLAASNPLFQETETELQSTLDSGLSSLIEKVTYNHRTPFNGRTLGEDPCLDLDVNSIKKAFGGSLPSRSSSFKLGFCNSAKIAPLSKPALISPSKASNNRSQKFIKKRSFNCKILNNRSIQVISGKSKAPIKFKLQDIMNENSSTTSQNGYRIDKVFASQTLMGGDRQTVMYPDVTEETRPRRNTLNGTEGGVGCTEEKLHEALGCLSSLDSTGSTLATTLDDCTGHNQGRRNSISYSFFSSEGLKDGNIPHMSHRSGYTTNHEDDDEEFAREEEH